jgi:ribosomal protein S18 acetylase RimI-like enzyme
MDFLLTSQMVDKISFALEDQKTRYVVDVATGELVPVAADTGPLAEDRFLPLPRWGSAEGFNLMESFVTSLQNPAHREILAAALASGKGVFRSFKNALKTNPEMERLWFRYKEKRLRAVVAAWYNAAREARGLSRMDPEPEEVGDLVTSDFSFSWGGRGREEDILRLDRDAFFELFPSETAQALAERYAEKRRGMPAPTAPEGNARLGAPEGFPLLVAEGPDGEVAGFAWGRIDGCTVHMLQLVVAPDLRGIGLGEALLREFLTDMRSRGMRKLTTELTGRSLRSVGFFMSLGFRPVTQVMECSLDEFPF